MTLPPDYADLAHEPAPKMLLEALALYGTKEKAGQGNNPVIMSWAKETDLMGSYGADSVAWCGLFMAVVCKRAGWSFPEKPLWALNWRAWGNPTPTAMLGDVIAFVRPGGGHVGIYVGEDTVCYHILGGNQGDAVSIIRIEKHRARGIRRAPWRIAQPGNVRPIKRSTKGAISKNEA